MPTTEEWIEIAKVHGIGPIPFRLRTDEMYTSAFSRHKGTPGYVAKTDTHITDVRKDGLQLKHVPQTLITYDMCLAAVQQNGEAMMYVPERFLNKDICYAAVVQGGLGRAAKKEIDW